MFKNIPFNSRYSINKDGLVKNNKTGNLVRTYLSSNGYIYVGLYNGKKQWPTPLHRALATTFIDNPENKPQVNHIDGNRINNLLSNLEWSTNKENNIHSFKSLGRRSGMLGKKSKFNKKIIQLKDGSVVKTWDSIKSARESGFHNITKVLSGRRKHSNGYEWKYIDSLDI